MIAVGLDLGSGKCGVVAAVNSRPVVAATVPVDPAHVGGAVAEIESAIVESRAALVVVEWGPFFCRPYPNEDPIAFSRRLSAQQANREVMVEIFALVKAICAARSIQVVKIAAATWRSLIGAKVERIPGDTARRQKMDAAVRDTLAQILGTGADILRTVHERDAMGALLGVAFAPAPAEKPKRPAKPRPSRAKPSHERIPVVLARPTTNRVVAAIEEHGRPIRQDYLARRLMMSPVQLGTAIRLPVQLGLVVRLSRGVYWLPGKEVPIWPTGLSEIQNRGESLASEAPRSSPTDLLH